MASPLHRARLDTVVATLLEKGAHRVADLGCGHGELLRRLQEHHQFTRLLGIDIDARALAHARDRLGLDLLRPNPRLAVCQASFEEADWCTQPVDAAVLLETIEHIEPNRLSRVERALFQVVRPGLVLITTPNREYNPLHGLAEGERRHPGHYFEWSREQFRRWCDGVARRQGYRADYRDIGPYAAGYGSSSQMACLARIPAEGRLARTAA